MRACARACVREECNVCAVRRVVCIVRAVGQRRGDSSAPAAGCPRAQGGPQDAKLLSRLHALRAAAAAAAGAAQAAVGHDAAALDCPVGAHLHRGLVAKWRGSAPAEAPPTEPTEPPTELGGAYRTYRSGKSSTEVAINLCSAPILGGSRRSSARGRYRTCERERCPICLCAVRWFKLVG